MISIKTISVGLVLLVGAAVSESELTADSVEIATIPSTASQTSSRYVDYFSPDCTFSAISNSILSKIGLSNPYSQYNCLVRTLQDAFRQIGFCIDGDIELIIQNKNNATNCTAFKTIWEEISKSGTEAAFSIFEGTIDQLGGLGYPPDELFSQQTLVEKMSVITNTTTYDEYGCYRQKINQSMGDTFVIISDPTCIESRIWQANMTSFHYELVLDYNRTVIWYIVLGSCIGFGVVLAVAIIFLNRSAMSIGKK